MKPVNHREAMALMAERLADGGAFLNVAGPRANTMTIGWGAIGEIWGKPVFMVLVRPQRHTWALLKDAGEFTVSVPTRDALRKALAFAGTQSGRDVDKFVGHGLTAAPARRVGAPIVAECGLHFECRTLFTQDMNSDDLSGEIAARYYPGRDYHTLFFGEILACYSTDGD